MTAFSSADRSEISRSGDGDLTGPRAMTTNPAARRLAGWYFVALLCIPFYIGPSIVANVQINAERLLIALLVLGCFFGLFRGLVLPPLRVLIARHPLTMMFFLAYFFWRALTAIASPYAVSNYLFINEILSTAFIPLIFFGIFFIRNDTRVLCRILSVSTIFIFFVVCTELMLGANLFTALAPADAGRAISDASIERAGELRAKGTFEHPLTLGNFVLLALPLVLFAGHSFSRKRSGRLVLALMLIVLGVATGSRSTMFGVAIIVLAYLVLSGLRLRTGWRKANYGYLILPFVPVILAGAVAFAEQRSGSDFFSSYIRDAQIRNGLIALAQSPWLGFGAGPGPIGAIVDGMTYGPGALYMWEANLTTVDNWYLSVLLGSGIPAFMALVGFNLSILLAALLVLVNSRIRGRLARGGDLGMFVGLTIACLMETGMMVVLSIFTLHPLYFIFAFWMLALIVRYRASESP